MKAIPIAIACCPECSAGYDLGELRELPELGRRERDDGAVFELRRCHCGAEFSARVDGLEDLDLWRDADAYMGSFGTQRSHRVVDLTPRRRWTEALDRVALWVAVVGLSLCVLASALGWW